MAAMGGPPPTASAATSHAVPPSRADTRIPSGPIPVPGPRSGSAARPDVAADDRLQGRSRRRRHREVLAWAVRARPFPYPPETAGSALALLYLVGGLTALLIVALPHPATLNIPIILTVGAVTPVVALMLWCLRHRLPSSAYPWLLGFGSGVITVLVAAAGSHSALVSTSFFYTWVVMYAVLFFSPVTATIQIGAAGAAYAVVLASSSSGGMDHITALEPIALTSVIGTTGVIVTILSRARESSQIDPLTRVANRRGLEELLSAATTTAERGPASLAVAMIDVDHFKSINDRAGHGAGDRVLQDLTAAWATVLRRGDALARYGGDEFVVILPHCSRDDAHTVLERMRTVTGPTVTCSIGAATWQPGDSASLLLGSADAALYQAKRLGRNRIAWAEVQAQALT